MRPCKDCGVPIGQLRGGRLYCEPCRKERRRAKDRRREKPRNPIDLARPCEDCARPIVVGAANKKRYCDECLTARRRDSERTGQRERLTRERFDALLSSQGGCAICGSDSPRSKLDWAVDHDHGTGKVRGILCHSCNRLLGAAGDSEQVLGRAIAYLADPPAERLKPPGWTPPDIAGVLARITT